MKSWSQVGLSETALNQTAQGPEPKRLEPKSSLAAVFVGAGRELQLRSFPIPAIRPGEALVRIECATLCGSDLHTIWGRRIEPQPSILGHEAIGRVVEVGSPVPTDLRGSPLRIGDRVIWSPIIACQQCVRCQEGFSQKCQQLQKYGHTVAEGDRALSGGFAEYIVLRVGSSIVRLNEDDNAEVFCPASCATATVAAAIRVGGAIKDRSIVVFGAGLLGLTAAAMAKSRGAQTVTIVDVDPQRLALAQEMGADKVVCIQADASADQIVSHPEFSETRFQVAFEMSGSSAAVTASVLLAEVAGRVILVGNVMPSPSVVLDPEIIVRRWLSLSGVHNYAPQDLQTAVDFLEATQTRFPFARLVEASFSLRQINEAVQYAGSHKPVRVAIVMKTELP